jgi:hypothetical protein
MLVPYREGGVTFIFKWMRQNFHHMSEMNDTRIEIDHHTKCIVG